MDSFCLAGIIVPYLHVTQAPFSTVHGAYESLEYTIARGLFPLLVLGVIYLTAVTVGRLFCGWACPFGLVQVHSETTLVTPSADKGRVTSPSSLSGSSRRMC